MSYKIMLVGGGSGGHLTPLVAVANAIKDLDSSAVTICVGQKGEKLQQVLDHPAIDRMHAINAGKFRRYHGESFLQQVADIKSLALNLRDFFYFIAGTLQAWRLLRKVKPDVIFLKGGFVCVPVGLAARLCKVPYITHDSDVIPGLANRITAGRAAYNTVAMAPENYPYPGAKTVQVGIPLQPEFKFVDDKAGSAAKRRLKLDTDSPVVFVVGGGLGARKINKALSEAAGSLLSEVPNLTIIHITGQKLFEETKADYVKSLDGNLPDNIRIIDFSTKLYDLSAAADLIITRAGATNMAEFAVQGKACIVVPNPVLTGGQQLHNASYLVDAGAVRVVTEEQLDELKDNILDLLGDKNKRKQLGERLHGMFVDGAAERIAGLLLDMVTTNAAKAKD